MLTPDFMSGVGFFVLPPKYKRRNTVMSEENKYSFENPEYRDT